MIGRNEEEAHVIKDSILYEYVTIVHPIPSRGFWQPSQTTTSFKALKPFLAP